jgi:type II secretory pathway pseudopilin PulG
MKSRHHGFSLLEMAVIILIMGMITILLFHLIHAGMQQKEKKHASSILEQTDLALTGYIMANHRLPCPDTDGNGTENCSDKKVGTVPYKTLGMADARARQIRYGVLRRTAAVDDPEAESRDPTPYLDRTADLTKSSDRFYPYLAIIGKTEEVFAKPDTATLPVLQTSGDGTPVPISANLNMLKSSNNFQFGVRNTLDFCWALRVAENLPPVEVASNVHMTVAGGETRQIAYGLALPGALDKSANAASLAFAFPRNLSAESVRAVTPGVLWARLECGEAMASIEHAHPNAATAAVVLYQGFFDFEQILEQAYMLETQKKRLMEANYFNAMLGKPISATAGILKLTGKAIGGNPVAGAAIAKAILSSTLAATGGLLAQANKIMTEESFGMAKQRYYFVKGLRMSARYFAEELLHHARIADQNGLYRGKQ